MRFSKAVVTSLFAISLTLEGNASLAQDDADRRPPTQICDRHQIADGLFSGCGVLRGSSLFFNTDEVVLNLKRQYPIFSVMVSPIRPVDAFNRSMSGMEMTPVQFDGLIGIGNYAPEKNELSLFVEVKERPERQIVIRCSRTGFRNGPGSFGRCSIIVGIGGEGASLVSSFLNPVHGQLKELVELSNNLFDIFHVDS